MKTEFDPIVVRWGDRFSGSRGKCTIIQCMAFPATKKWLTDFLRKIVALDYEHEKEILLDLADYLEYNAQRMEDDLALCKTKKDREDTERTRDRYKKNLTVVRERLEVIK